MEIQYFKQLRQVKPWKRKELNILKGISLLMEEKHYELRIYASCLVSNSILHNMKILLQTTLHLSNIHLHTSSEWWRHILSTSGCHDSPGAIGTLSKFAPNSDFTSSFKPSIHCGREKYDATTCRNIGTKTF